jgi:hypothetical protein
MVLLLLPLLHLLLLLMMLLLLLYRKHRVRLLSCNPFRLQQLLALRCTVSLLCQQLLQLCHILLHEPAQAMASTNTYCSCIPAAATTLYSELKCSAC